MKHWKILLTMVSIILIATSLSIGYSNPAQNSNYTNNQISNKTQKPPGNVIARVGNYYITNEDLSDKISSMGEQEEYAFLSYLKRRELALEKLINELLLYSYARESGIEVTSEELDNYFISQYGDHPRVTTDGIFDYDKYQALKRNPEIRSLLNGLSYDLIVHKTETIIKNRFQLADNELIDRYFLENTEIDLSYALLAEELLDLSSFVHPSKAYDYYLENKDKYEPVNELKISFFVVPYQQIYKEYENIEIPSEEIINYIEQSPQQIIINLLTILNPDYLYDYQELSNYQETDLKNILLEQDSVKVYNAISRIIREEKIEQAGQLKALQATNRLNNGLSIEYPILSLKILDYPYDYTNPPLFQRNSLLPIVRNSEEGTYSYPIRINLRRSSGKSKSVSYSDDQLVSPRTHNQIIQQIKNDLIQENKSIDEGYLVFEYKTLPEDDQQTNLPVPLAEEVWQDFVNQQNLASQNMQLKEIFQTRLDEMYVPAIFVTRLVVDKNVVRAMDISDNELYDFYNNNRKLFTSERENRVFEEFKHKVRETFINKKYEELHRWCAENIHKAGYELQKVDSKEYQPGIKGSNEIIYLEKFPDDDYINRLIKKSFLNEKTQQSAGIETFNEIIYYAVNSWYPSHLPNYNDIASHVYQELSRDATLNWDDYKNFYNENKSYFIAPDSLKLTGLYYPIDKDAVTLSEKELRNYYEERKGHLFTDHQITIEYVRILDPQIQKRSLVDRILSWINSGVDLYLINSILGENAEIFSSAETTTIRPKDQLPSSTSQTTVSRSLLPSKIINILDHISVSNTTSPIYIEDSWYIIKKINENPPRQATFNEIRNSLAEELRQKKAEDYAYQKAYQSFIEYTRVRDIINSQDSIHIFTTKLKNAEENFGPLGDISTYRSRFIRLRRNQRLNTLYVDDNGYGVVFILDNKQGSQLEFEEALPLVKKYYHAEMSNKHSQKYARQLRDLVIRGEDPSSLLVFWGGWHQEKELSFNDFIPGVLYSNQIIENAARRNKGEISPIMRNRQNEYLFYRVERKASVSMDCFWKDKDSFIKSITETEFYKWLESYKNEIGVEKF